MERKVDWTSWDEWKRIWEKWERLHVRINMEHIQFVDLYNLFMREVKRLRREVPEFDPATIDLEGILSPDLTYGEAKKLLLSVLHKPPTEEEYDAMYEAYVADLTRQVEEKYPEVVEKWKKEKLELEREAEGYPAEKRKAMKFKKLAEDLRYQLEETIRRHEEEKKALEKKIAPVKLRILKAFRLGIMDYGVGDVVETRDLDWALGLIEKGLAERVTAEVPVEVKPPPPVVRPPPRVVEVDRELERKLRDVFETTLRAGIREEKLPGISPTRFIPEFRLELDAIKTLRTEAEMVRAVEEFAKSIVRRESRPPPPPRPLPPGWRKVENGYLTPEGEFIPEEEYPRYVAPEVAPPEVRTRFLQWLRRFEPPGPERKAISLHPKDWLLSRYNMTWGEFLKLPPDEAKMLLDKYERECREEK